jgi:type III pantothenate kinase
MKLLLDIGNTRIKWGYDLHGVLVNTGELLHRDSDKSTEKRLTEYLQSRPVEVCAVNVAGPEITELVSGVIADAFELPVRFFESSESCGPVRCAYQDVSQLGADRWAAVVGAWMTQRRAVCVVDAGTAVTVDMVDQDGQHLGGYIVPGFDLMRQALHRETGSIKKADRGSVERSASPEPGTDTSAAISNGSLRAVLGLINSSIADLRERSEAADLVVTGGDAITLLPHLNSLHAVHSPFLVLEGLRELVNLDA